MKKLNTRQAHTDTLDESKLEHLLRHSNRLVLQLNVSSSHRTNLKSRRGSRHGRRLDPVNPLRPHGQKTKGKLDNRPDD